MTNKQTPYTVDKPTRKFVEFFYWLKNSMKYVPEICIDVGAAGGTPSIYQSFRQARHLAFEPQPSFIDELKKSLEDFDHEIFQMGLLDVSGVMDIVIPTNKYTATMISHGSKKDGKDIQSVKVSTLDEELEGQLEGKRVLLKTDCQGGDLQVIMGGKKTLQFCDVVIMETSLYRFWGSHHPDFYDIVSYMKSEGFVVFDILDGTFKPSNRALGQLDLVFVKENGVLRPHHYW